MNDGHKPNHRCLACGTEYWACDSCDKKISKTWRMACCTEGHYRAYYAMWQYGQGQISREEAKAVLEEQNALSWEKAPGKQLIEEIMAADEPTEAAVAEQEESSDEPAREKGGFLYGKKKKRR